MAEGSSGNAFTGSVSKVRLGPGRQRLPAAEAGQADPFELLGAVTASIDASLDNVEVVDCGIGEAEYLRAVTRATGSLTVNIKDSIRGTLHERVLNGNYRDDVYYIELYFHEGKRLLSSIQFTGRKNGATAGRILRSVLEFVTLGRPIYDFSPAGRTAPTLLPPTQPQIQQPVPVNRGVVLTWFSSEPRGAPVQGYRVEFREEAANPIDPDQWQTVGVTQSNGFLIQGLDNGTEYRFRVTALSIAGNSFGIAIGTPAPQQGLPGAVRDLEAVGGPGEIALTWKAPTGASIPELVATVTGYFIEWRPAGEVTWEGTTVTRETLSYTITSLRNEELYTVRIRGNSELGYGDGVVVRATPIREVGGPYFTSFALTYGGSGTVNIAWAASLSPDDVALVTIVSGRISWVSGLTTRRTRALSAGQLTNWQAGTDMISGLTTGVEYTIQVELNWSARGVEKIVTPSQASLPVTYTPYGPPFFPSGSEISVTFTANPGTKRTDISAAIPAGDGNGAAIVSTTIEYRIGTGAWTSQQTINDGLGRTIAFNLENIGGQTFQIRARLNNGIDQANYLTSAQETAPINLPGAPQSVSVARRGSGLRLTWNASAAGSNTVANYTVFWWKETDTSTISTVRNNTVRSYILTSVDVNTQYYFEVLAVDSAGNNGARSSRTGASIKSEPPTGVVGSSIDIVRQNTSDMNITHGAVSSRTTENIVGYRIYRVPNSLGNTGILNDESTQRSPQPTPNATASTGGSYFRFSVARSLGYWIGVAVRFQRRGGTIGSGEEDNTAPTWILVEDGPVPTSTVSFPGGLPGITLSTPLISGRTALRAVISHSETDITHTMQWAAHSGIAENLSSTTGTPGTGKTLTTTTGLTANSVHSVNIAFARGSNPLLQITKQLTIGRLVTLTVNPVRDLTTEAYEEGAIVKWKNPATIADAAKFQLTVTSGAYSASEIVELNSATTEYTYTIRSRPYNSEHQVTIRSTDENEEVFSSSVQSSFTTSAVTPPDPTNARISAGYSGGNVTFTMRWNHSFTAPIGSSTVAAYFVTLAAGSVTLATFGQVAAGTNTATWSVAFTDRRVLNKRVGFQVIPYRRHVSVTDNSWAGTATSNRVRVRSVTPVKPSTVSTVFNFASRRWDITVTWPNQPAAVHSLEIQYKVSTASTWTTAPNSPVRATGVNNWGTTGRTFVFNVAENLISRSQTINTRARLKLGDGTIISDWTEATTAPSSRKLAFKAPVSYLDRNVYTVNNAAVTSITWYFRLIETPTLSATESVRLAHNTAALTYPPFPAGTSVSTLVNGANPGLVWYDSYTPMGTWNLRAFIYDSATSSVVDESVSDIYTWDTTQAPPMQGRSRTNTDLRFWEVSGNNLILIDPGTHDPTVSPP